MIEATCFRATGAVVQVVLLACLLLSATAQAELSFYQHVQSSSFEQQAQRVIEEGFVVRGNDPFPITPPIDWSSDPHGDANWRYQLNAMYPLAPIFQALAKEDRPAWRVFAREVFLDWIRFNIDEDRDNPFKWNDMATGVRASYLAQLIAYERQAAEIDSGTLTRLVVAGRLHLIELSDPAKFAFNNHGIFQAVGIAALCEVHAYPECGRALPYSRDRYRELFDQQFNVEGMHTEHSPEYHLLGLNVFGKIEDTRLLTLPAEGLARLEKARRNLQWMIHPDSGFAALGDTEPRSVAGVQRHDESARWLATQGARGEPPTYGVHAAPAAGYGFARLQKSVGDSYLAFTVAHHSWVHKHADSFSFEWSDRGRRILVDSGKWGYDDAPPREYVTSARAHNVVELVGLDFRVGHPPEELPQISAKQAGDLAVLRASGRHAPGRFHDPAQDRWLIMNPGTWLIVADSIRTFWPRDMVQWFQFPPEAEVQESGSGFLVRFPWTDSVLHVFNLGEAEAREALRGEKGAQWAGWHSVQYRELEPSWQIGFRASGFYSRFATVFRWVAPGEPMPMPKDAEVSEENVTLCWVEDGRSAGTVAHWRGGDLRLQSCDQP